MHCTKFVHEDIFFPSIGALWKEEKREGRGGEGKQNIRQSTYVRCELCYMWGSERERERCVRLRFWDAIRRGLVCKRIRVMLSYAEASNPQQPDDPLFSVVEPPGDPWKILSPVIRTSDGVCYIFFKFFAPTYVSQTFHFVFFCLAFSSSFSFTSCTLFLQAKIRACVYSSEEQ